MASCEEMVYKQGNLPYDYYQVFRDMRLKQELCDVTLNLEDNSIYAHKVILAASIPYFRTLFGGSALEERPKEVVLIDVNPTALEALIDFAYTCALKITSENVQVLLSTACFLEVDFVKKACVEFLLNGISPLQAISIRDLGIKLNCESLVDKLDKYIKENFDEVSSCHEFTNLPYWYLKDLVSSNDLHISSEEKVFEAMIRWVEARSDPEERSSKLPELLSCIRMPFLKLYYLKDVIATNELVKESLQCRDILDDARDYHLFPEKRHDVKAFWKFTCTPRQFSKNNSEDKQVCFTIKEQLSLKNLEKKSDQKNFKADSSYGYTSIMLPPSSKETKYETFSPNLKLGEFNFLYSLFWHPVVPSERKIIKASRLSRSQPKPVSE